MTTEIVGRSSREVAWEDLRVQRGFEEVQSSFGGWIRKEERVLSWAWISFFRVFPKSHNSFKEFRANKSLLLLLLFFALPK